jgi:hypothetical protein
MRTTLEQELSMDAKDKQLAVLLSLMARSHTHLTAAITSMSFELLSSTDPAVRGAGKRMITRMATINEEIDQQWQGLGELYYGQFAESLPAIEEVDMHTENKASLV